MATDILIYVFDANIAGALQRLKKTMLKTGLFKEMKKRTYYEKPSVKKRRKRTDALKRQRKARRRVEALDAAQVAREGL